MHSSSNLTFAETAPETIVWTQTSFLGDIVLTTGALALARRYFPGSRQVLITTAIGKDLLQGEAFVDQLIVFEKGRLGTVAAMRAVKQSLGHCDKSNAIHLQVHRSFRSSLLARYLGLPTITYRQSDLSFLAQLTVERVATLHEAARIGLLLEPLGVSRREIAELRPQLASQRLEHHRVAPRVGVAPGSVWGTKRWPKEKFAELVAALLDEYRDLEVVLLGSKAEKEQTDFIAQKLSCKRLLNLAGETSLNELKIHIANLDLLVSNDSSPIHFASALNIPTVAIFGATVPELGFGPLASKSAVAEIDLACRPCSDHGPQTCPLGHFKCMRDLSVEQVLVLSKRIISETTIKRS